MNGIGENVEDVRPDEFLRGLRETGDVGATCKKIGWTEAEFRVHCDTNPQFDRTQVETYLEYIEDAIMASARMRLERIRVTEMMALSVRHG
jgi:hypothetical protein